jgi:uncharacterized protein (DUF952 family)
MIYRIAETHDWEAAQASGYFASLDLAAEGFIHCCTAQQIAAVANRYYQGHETLVLLEIDEAQVHVPLKWEDLTNTGELFPHVYGRIPRAALVRCLVFKPDADGRFSSPLVAGSRPAR